MKNMHDELMDKLYRTPMSQWNIGSLAKEFLISKVDDLGNATEIDEKALEKLDEVEMNSLNGLFAMYYFIDYVKNGDKSDWSTKNIGAFFVEMVLEAQLIENNEIDDVFTPKNDNVSLPDIATMFNLKDARVLLESRSKLNTPATYEEAEPCDYSSYSFIWLGCPSIGERYSTFQTCFDKILNETDDDGNKLIFKREEKIIRKIQPSPCLYTEMFPECKEYCTWHKNYFTKITKDAFLQVMSYASPQRKLVRDQTPIEMKMAGNLNNLLQTRSCK